MVSKRQAEKDARKAALEQALLAQGHEATVSDTFNQNKTFGSVNSFGGGYQVPPQTPALENSSFAPPVTQPNSMWGTFTNMLGFGVPKQQQGPMQNISAIANTTQSAFINQTQLQNPLFDQTVNQSRVLETTMELETEVKQRKKGNNKSKKAKIAKATTRPELIEVHASGSATNQSLPRVVNQNLPQQQTEAARTFAPQQNFFQVPVAGFPQPNVFQAPVARAPQQNFVQAPVARAPPQNVIQAPVARVPQQNFDDDKSMGSVAAGSGDENAGVEGADQGEVESSSSSDQSVCEETDHQKNYNALVNAGYFLPSPTSHAATKIALARIVSKKFIFLRESEVYDLLEEITLRHSREKTWEIIQQIAANIHDRIFPFDNAPETAFIKKICLWIDKTNLYELYWRKSDKRSYDDRLGTLQNEIGFENTMKTKKVSEFNEGVKYFDTQKKLLKDSEPEISAVIESCEFVRLLKNASPNVPLQYDELVCHKYGIGLTEYFEFKKQQRDRRQVPLLPPSAFLPQNIDECFKEVHFVRLFDRVGWDNLQKFLSENKTMRLTRDQEEQIRFIIGRQDKIRDDKKAEVLAKIQKVFNMALQKKLKDHWNECSGFPEFLELEAAVDKELKSKQAQEPVNNLLNAFLLKGKEFSKHTQHWKPVADNQSANSARTKNSAIHANARLIARTTDGTNRSMGFDLVNDPQALERFRQMGMGNQSAIQEPELTHHDDQLQQAEAERNDKQQFEADERDANEIVEGRLRPNQTSERARDMARQLKRQDQERRAGIQPSTPAPTHGQTRQNKNDSSTRGG